MNKNIYIAIILIMAMVAAPVSAERITEDVEIRGEIMTGNGTMNYTFQNAAMFWYELNTGLSSETLNVTVTGARTVTEKAIVYKCVPQVVNHKNSVLGTYTIVGFMAEKFVVYDDKTAKLVKLLIEWDDNDDRVLAVGESLEMPEGYTLIAREIDLEGSKCLLSLYKDGFALDTEIVGDGATYQYLDDDDVLICSVKIDSVFRGTDSNMVIVKLLFLMSENILEVDVGDSFGIMEVTSTSGGITLKNDDSVTLGEDDEVDIMGDLYFKVADDPLTLRYYLAKVVSLECDECPTCPEITEPEPCPPCNPEIVEVVNETIVYIEVPADPVDPVDDKMLPGFAAVMALVGLLVIVYLIVRQKE